METDPPSRAFCAFPVVSAFGMKSYNLALDIVKNTGVLHVHGSGLGRYSEGSLRLCYAGSTEAIGEAIRRMDSHLPKLLRK